MTNKQERLNILRLPAVIARVGLSKPSIYRLMKKHSFPQSVKLGERAIGWVESSIDDWIKARIEAA